MIIHALDEQVVELVRQKQKIDQAVDLIKTQITNKNYDLEERWNLYLALVDSDLITNIESYGDGHVETIAENMTMYDNFYIDRHQTYYYPDMWNRILEEKYGTEESRIEWRENVLEDGNAGFIHDW